MKMLYYRIIKLIFSLILFILAVQFEEASSQRLTLLIVLFSCMMAWGFLRPVMGNRFWLFLVDGILLFLLEYQSKFVINYFLHSLYFVIILEAGITLTKKYTNLVTIPLALISLSKFVYYIFYQFNAASISALLFNLFAFLFVITLIHYTLLQKEEREKNEMLYRELLQTHRQLKQYTRQSEQAAILEERNRIARDIHDAVGHQLTSLIMQLEMAGIQINKENELTRIKELLDRAKETARQSLEETRKAVNALRGDELTGIDGIHKLIARFHRESGIEIETDFSTDLKELPVSADENYVLFRVIQESMTNAVRHGKTKKLTVMIRHVFSETAGDKRDVLEFSVCHPQSEAVAFTEGFGMRGMRSRLKEVSGEIQFTSSDDRFCVRGRFPLKNTVSDKEARERFL